jgi:hypothetical protein
MAGRATGATGLAGGGAGLTRGRLPGKSMLPSNLFVGLSGGFTGAAGLAGGVTGGVTGAMGLTAGATGGVTGPAGGVIGAAGLAAGLTGGCCAGGGATASDFGFTGGLLGGGPKAPGGGFFRSAMEIPLAGLCPVAQPINLPLPRCKASFGPDCKRPVDGRHPTSKISR